ncbi:hypothetical protein PRBRB14_14500 [Hallella multisaccharivorax DSM 17128]|uniref:Uncharacterized protein n=1 Tax=Hallella multisaccharivorax DSM 17128 TaxID=688246 RepID=F8NCJ3_9BACT|nr:hypothetical protein [Hallella multisaccharivorax]EGN57029.1 hypothetical protein Premu_1619 [Hallella multisaccharivorax DSM 17128]GJG30571.1 hypothetical protein PRBRB14_14500 [Hallella multisaccharivorax DSM 17128]
MNVNHHQTKRDRSYFEWGDNMQIVRKGNGDMRPLKNLHPLNFHPYTIRRMNIFDQKMPLEVIFE